MSAFSIHKAVFKKVSKNCRTVTSLSWLYLKFSRSKTYLFPPKPNLLPILFLFNGITILFPSTNTKTSEPTSTLPPPYAPILSSLPRFLVLQWQHCVSPTLSHPIKIVQLLFLQYHELSQLLIHFTWKCPPLHLTFPTHSSPALRITPGLLWATFYLL